MTNPCFFCTIQQQQNHSIWESDTLFSIFDNYPVNPGHALIIPKRHVSDLHQLHVTEWCDIKQAIDAVINIVVKTDLFPIYQGFIQEHRDDQSVWFCQKALASPYINIQTNGYNHGVNDGNAAGRTINHFHWHVIPRFYGDMADPRGGVRFVIPEMGNYKIPRT